MGSGTSQQRLGERVLGGVEQIKAAWPETLDVMVRSIGDSFLRCAPFSEHAVGRV